MQRQRSDFERGHRTAVHRAAKFIRQVDWAPQTKRRLYALVRLLASFSRDDPKATPAPTEPAR